MSTGIILAGGKSDEMGAQVDRAFLNLGSKPVLAYSLAAFEHCADIDDVIVVVRKERVDAARALCRMFGSSKLRDVVAGGARRQQSVEQALAVVSDECTLVTIHEVSRPCVRQEDLTLTIKSAARYGSGVAAIPVHGSVLVCERGQKATKALDSEKLWITLSPQSYKIELLRAGIAAAKKQGVHPADESEAVALVCQDLRVVRMDKPGVRISGVDDLALAHVLLKPH